MGRPGEMREKIRSSLERYIAESGYTQKEIAEKLGVSKSSVTNWIKGKNSPDANLVMPICNLLNITIGQFYGEDSSGPLEKPTPVAESGLALQKIALIQKILNLDLSEIETLNQMADSVLGKRDG